MIQSMTAFARDSDQDSSGMATWEIRVVNHRYFDCNIKLPEMFRHLEANIRLVLQQKLQRGRVDCMLKVDADAESNIELTLNTELVKKLLNVAQEIKSYLPMSTIDPMKILAWPRVLQTSEVNSDVMQDMVMHLFTRTLQELVAMREREGVALLRIIKEKLQEMAGIIDKVKDKLPHILTEQRLRITKRLEEVVVSFDQLRLEQEIIYFSQKIDVTEEIDRLYTHIKEVSRTLVSGDVVGKRLDFLMQELNREANTLASKSVDITTTQAALELKVLIEQMREQVQNIV